MIDDAGIGRGQDDDATAAEYVLGVLDRSERAHVELRAGRDPAFARLIAGWEARLAGFNHDFAEMTPPASIKAALDRRLFGAQAAPSPGAPATGIWSSLAFWRFAAIAALIALALLGFVMLRTVERGGAGETLVAVLSSQQSNERFVALYNSADRSLRVTHLAGQKPTGRDYELWLIEGKNAPVSLGLVGGTGAKAPAVPVALRAKLTQGVTLAVSLEPAGGSKTGAPTGPVVALGPAEKM
jgi:anti-sigma-K factor RskA